MKERKLTNHFIHIILTFFAHFFVTATFPHNRYKGLNEYGNCLEFHNAEDIGEGLYL